MRRTKSAVLCLTIVLVPVVAAILYIWQARTITYKPTGDPMFDKYALALVDAYRSSLSPFARKKVPGDSRTLLERIAYPEAGAEYFTTDSIRRLDQVLDDLKIYDDNSDYWEFRFLLDRDEGVLLEAIDRGLATPAMLDLFDFSDMLRTDPNKALEITELGIELDPDNSWYYYQKANLLIVLGDLESAYAALQAGNAAPRNEWPRPFSLRIVDEHLQDATDRDTQAVAVNIWSRTPIPMLLYIRNNSQLVTDAVTDGEEPLLLNDWLEFTRRLGQMDGQGLLGILIAISTEELALRNVLELQTLTDSDREQINQSLAGLKEARQFVSDTFLGNANSEPRFIREKYERCLLEERTIPEIQRLCNRDVLQLELSGGRAED